MWPTAARARKGGHVIPVRRLLVLVVVGALAFVILGGVIFFASDRAVAADVVEKHCSIVGDGDVVVVTRTFGLRHTAHVGGGSCLSVPVGAYVIYHIRSGHTTVYEKPGGRCIWDSVGPCVG